MAIIKRLVWGLGLLLCLGSSSPPQPLVPVPVPSFSSELDPQLWSNSSQKQALLQAVGQSLRYLNSSQAAQAYGKQSIAGISQARVRRSLVRFQTLLRQAPNPQSFQRSLEREFIFYRARGNDGQGLVHFTGYFEPVYTASRRPTEKYRYPIYRAPKNLSRWPRPHPSRAELEGQDGLGGQLKGLELLWFEDRLSAYLVQIQGSAKIILTDGSRVSVAVAGTTAHEYTSIGKELVQDGVFAPGTVTLPLILDYFRHQPQQLNNYLPRNQRFVFFKLTPANSRAQGSLGVPVTAERSIATDKALMPPGALALIEVPIPNAKLQKVPNLRFVLDQDTGSAIKGPGRVDIFMGTGSLAGERAGLMSDDGQLYYLLSKN